MSREEPAPASPRLPGGPSTWTTSARPPGGPGPPRGDATALLLTQGWQRTFTSLENRNFRVLWLGMLASFLGMQMGFVARGWLAYDLTGSATALGVVSLAWGLPMLLLSLLGGVVADWAEKRNVLLVTQAGTGIIALITAVLVSTGLIQFWHLAALGLGQGMIFAFNSPARQALIPELVGEENLMNAIALNNAGMNLTRIIGPSLAGTLIGVPFVGMSGVYYLVALCYVLVLVSLMLIPTSGRPRRAFERPLWQEMGSGLMYIRTSPVLLTLISMAFIPIILGWPYMQMLPVFASDKVLGVGSFGFGLMSAAAGAGSLVGSLVVAYLSGYRRRALLQLATGLAFGGFLFLFAVSPTFLLAMMALPVVGMALSMYLALNNTMIFSYADQEVHGRVMSVYMMTFSLMPFGTIAMGSVTDMLGPRATVAGAGLLILAFISVVGLLRPSYRNIE